MSPTPAFGMEFSREFRASVADYEREQGKQLSQFELGQMIGVSQSQAGKILRGQARPSWGVVEKVAQQFPRHSREKWLSLAGYGLQPESPEEDLAQRVAERTAALLRNPADYYKILFYDLFELCSELDIKMRRVWFHGGRDQAFESRGQAEASILRLVDDLIEDYPEHAERLREFRTGLEKDTP